MPLRLKLIQGSKKLSLYVGIWLSLVVLFQSGVKAVCLGDVTCERTVIVMQCANGVVCDPDLDPCTDGSNCGQSVTYTQPGQCPTAGYTCIANPSCMGGWSPTATSWCPEGAQPTFPPQPTPGPGTPQPTPFSCSPAHKSSGTICNQYPDMANCQANETEGCACGGCPISMTRPGIHPAAVVFLDINGNGDFDPSVSNPEKLISVPNTTTNYGGGSVSCGLVENQYVVPKVGFSIWASGSGDSSMAGYLGALCYRQNSSLGTFTNDSPYSECHRIASGCIDSSDDYKSSYHVDEVQCAPGPACYSPCGSGSCVGNPGFGNTIEKQAAVAGLLYYMPGNLHNLLNNNSGSIWLSGQDGMQDVGLTLASMPAGYTISSAKYYQYINGNFTERVKCSATGAYTRCNTLASANTLQFTNAYAAGMGDEFRDGQQWYAVAMWGVKPPCPTPEMPANISVNDTVGEITVGWSDVSGETSYNLYRISNPPGAWSPTPAPLASLAANTVSYIDNGATCGTGYDYGIAAVNACGVGQMRTSGPISCAAYNSWYGAEGGDIIAAAGNVGVSMPPGAPTSLIPATLPDAYFSERAAGSNVPGMVFGVKGADWGGSPALNSSTVSIRGWLADLKNAITSQVDKAENSYAAISERIAVKVEAPLTVTTNIISNETEWNNLVNSAPDTSKFKLSDGSTVVVLKRSGNLQFIGPIDVSNAGANNKKTIWLVDGSFGMGTSGGAGVNNKGVFMGDDANGFLAVIASGSVTIGPAIGDSTSVEDLNIRDSAYAAHVEGIYYAGTTFSTSVSTRALKLEGSAIGMTGVTLARTSAGPHPVEYFKFRPDLTMTLNQLGLRRKVQMDLQVP